MQISKVELEFLHLAVLNNDCIDENDIENSNLKRLGTGNILDVLAEMIQKKLFEQKHTKFCITNEAKNYLWQKNIPLDLRILRLLKITPVGEKEISRFLMEDDEIIIKMIEKLRKNGLVVIVPTRKDNSFHKLYEILPEGVQYIKNNVMPKQKHDLESNEDLQLISEVQQQINDLPIDQSVKKSIGEKLEKIRKKLEF